MGGVCIVGGGGRRFARGRLGSHYAWMCVVESKGHGSFFGLKGVRMSENISLKMGVRFAMSLDMCKTLLVILTYKNSENELKSTQTKLND